MAVHPTRWHASRFGNRAPDSLLILHSEQHPKKTSTERERRRWISKSATATMDPSVRFVPRRSGRLPDLVLVV